MTRVTIICHAATEAVRAARFPRDEEIDDGAAVLRSSGAPVAAARWLAGPERRTLSTAAAMRGDGPVEIDHDLRDWDVGRWAGRDLSGLQTTEPADLARWMADAAAAPHGGESLLDLLSRVARWLDRQAAAPRISAVSHPAILRAAVVHALAAGPASFWRIDVRPLCRARLSHDGRRWVLQGLTAHPAPDA